MTIPGWGRLTPTQIDMLMLSGHVLYLRLPEKKNPTDDERMKAMSEGRQALLRTTGKDFGYDLKQWHDYLLGDKKSGYKHVYGWRVVRPAIEAAMEDPHRHRLVRQLEARAKLISSETFTCPCCGYPGLSSPPYERLTGPPVPANAKPPYCMTLGDPSYDVCDCCGFEFGNDDDPGTAPPESFEEYLEEWVKRGAEWFDPRKKPAGWNLLVQLSEAGIRPPQ